MVMQRSRQQVLFQYLPNNTFDYSGQRGIWRTTRLETNDASHQIDEEYIANRVLSFLRNWDAGHQGFPMGGADRYAFVEPSGVRSEVFPTTFRCRRCNKAHGYYTENELREENPDLECTRCEGNLEQYHYLSVCPCGEMRRLYIQNCPEHGDEYIIMDTRGSQKIRNFRWSCQVNGCNWSEPIRFRQRCGCEYESPAATQQEEADNGDRNSEPEDEMYTTVHRAGSVYYPKYLTSVNLQSPAMSQLRGDADGAYKGIAAHLGLTDHDGFENADLDEPINGIEFDDDRLIEVYQNEPDVGSLDEAQDWLRNRGEIEAETVRERLDRLLTLRAGDSESELAHAGDELVQYVLANRELTTSTLGELEEQARERGFTRKADRIRTYGTTLDRVGIDDVRLIEDFPIQTFVFGYTRVSRTNARINAFTQNSSDGDGTPIFVDTTENEAIQFDLDINRVLLWLACNIPETSNPEQVNGKITLPEIRDPDDLGRARDQIAAMEEEERWAFLLNHLLDMNAYRWFESLPDGRPVTNAVTRHIFQLLHTMSHLLLKQSSTISGFERTNLSEYLFPRALSLVIYANNRYEFNMGGMATMIEQQLDLLLRQAAAHGNECKLDPVCSHRGGACLDCLHVSEISCSYFNQRLMRDRLFGSRPSVERDIAGYWEL